MTIEQKYITHLENCFEKAERKESKLIPEVNSIMGMTGEKTRCLYNNLLEMDDARYLEIGCWQGSSTCSAMYGNKAKVVAIDNFSSFGSPRQIFIDNFVKYKGENDALFMDGDCFALDISVLPKFNIYCFDGDHSEESQFKGLDYFLPKMDDVFVFIVDDFNWAEPRAGTYAAILKNKLEVVWSKEILLTQDNEFTYSQEEADKTWWNGIGVFILKKTK